MMNPETIFVSILTAAITAAFVAGVNHFWNRRYLIAVEREKYRQALFSEKLKAYLDITMLIHEFVVFCGETSARFAVDNTDDISNEMAAIYLKLLEVKGAIHRNMLIIPDGTLDKITEISESFLKIIEIRESVQANNRVVILAQSLYRIIDVLRDDLGIEEFGKKLK